MTSSRRIGIARGALLLGVVCALSACGGSSSNNAVTVKGFAFSPQTLTVKVGTLVTWTNKDDIDHAIYDKGGAFQGPKFGSVAGTRTFSHTYTSAGTFPYFCGVHNSMAASVVVTN